MKQSTVCIVLLYLLAYGPSPAYSQDDSLQATIHTRHFNVYLDPASSTCEGDTGTITYGEIIEMEYPEIITPYPAFNALIRDTIRQITGLPNPANSAAKEKITWKCINDKPAETYVEYKVNQNTNRLLSLTIFEHQYACCGGNGSSHMVTPLTYDFINKSFLSLKDVVKPAKVPVINQALREKMREMGFEDSNPGHPSQEIPDDFMHFPFAISQGMITIYHTYSQGCCIRSAEIKLPVYMWHGMISLD